MKKMVKIEILDLEYVNGPKYKNRGVSEVLIDPNVIAELYPIVKVNLTDTTFGYGENKTIGQLEVASLYTSNVHGRGINGVSTHNYITKASYEKLVGLFEIV